MLEQAGVLTDAGYGELAAILSRRPHLDRAVEDRDFFTSYSTGVRSVVGDVAPLSKRIPTIASKSRPSSARVRTWIARWAGGHIAGPIPRVRSKRSLPPI
jgi:hypothetical protein